ncbi:hypothetical protein GQ55_8G050600 [Panicum hallii var. hallii]|uniref:Thioredoxin domain-containing protein n=1 Tax=Panicum hallii var. hallii TaxID=1504633 RepID=A0A2T7CKV6_9POAL|nr:hypothetical protein GQ55_8G050600 [Panicum hallii var. hallii]
MSSEPPVTILNTDEELQQNLESAKKLVVLEFVKQGSKICEYVKLERDRIAQQMKKEAVFYELDVDTFKKFATKFQVEALPAFVVMHKFVKKRHVVGTDDLKKAIEDTHAKFGSEPKEPAQNSEPKEPARNYESVQPAQTPESIQPAKNSPEPEIDYRGNSPPWHPQNMGPEIAEDTLKLPAGTTGWCFTAEPTHDSEPPRCCIL